MEEQRLQKKRSSHLGAPLSRLVGFGSDGAAFMIGKKSLETRTATGKAGEQVPFVSTSFIPTLKQLFYYFENSAVRMSCLKSLEKCLTYP